MEKKPIYEAIAKCRVLVSYSSIPKPKKGKKKRERHDQHTFMVGNRMYISERCQIGDEEEIVE